MIRVCEHTTMYSSDCNGCVIVFHTPQYSFILLIKSLFEVSVFVIFKMLYCTSPQIQCILQDVGSHIATPRDVATETKRGEATKCTLHVPLLCWFVYSAYTL